MEIASPHGCPVDAWSENLVASVLMVISSSSTIFVVNIWGIPLLHQIHIMCIYIYFHIYIRSNPEIQDTFHTFARQEQKPKDLKGVQYNKAGLWLNTGTEDRHEEATNLVQKTKPAITSHAG